MEQIRRLKSEARTLAEANGHMIGHGKTEPHGEQLRYWAYCHYCEAEIFIETEPKAFGGIKVGRALTTRCLALEEK